ncbi:MAG: hypothetical protein FRX49_01525 [Trebouxia sp. A1-2]|nr:MAG: hypothetical protein FRX49_01525 [Trebouxia sp. A1-2]
MKPIVYANPQERLLDEKTLPVVVQELKERATLGLDSNSIVCDLSSRGLTLDAALQLAELLEARTGLFALDLSLNRINANSWDDVCRLARKFLDAVEYLDLSLNHLTPLQSLKENKVAEKELEGFRDRLSLGSDCNSFCGDPDVDHWTRNARRFKQEAYGFEYDG